MIIEITNKRKQRKDEKGWTNSNQPNRHITKNKKRKDIEIDRGRET